jgi:acylphosphatase
MSEATRESRAALRALLHGRVQGVGFRFFVRRRALERGLAGWVRNLDNGSSVEVMAEGPRSELEGLLEDLRRGPPMAWVERVQPQWLPATGLFEGFEVRR